MSAYSQLLLPKKKEKGEILPGFKETYSDSESRELTGAFVPRMLRGPAPPLPPAWSPGPWLAGRAGTSNGLAAPPSPHPPLPERQSLYFSFFPGIMALDINDSRQQLAVIDVELTAGARKCGRGRGAPSQVRGFGTIVSLRECGRSQAETWRQVTGDGRSQGTEAHTRGPTGHRRSEPPKTCTAGETRPVLWPEPVLRGAWPHTLCFVPPLPQGKSRAEGTPQIWGWDALRRALSPPPRPHEPRGCLNIRVSWTLWPPPPWRDLL